MRQALQNLDVPPPRWQSIYVLKFDRINGTTRTTDKYLASCTQIAMTYTATFRINRLRLSSGLPAPLRGKVPPNLTPFTPEVSPWVLNNLSPLRLPISPPGLKGSKRDYIVNNMKNCIGLKMETGVGSKPVFTALQHPTNGLKTNQHDKSRPCLTMPCPVNLAKKRVNRLVSAATPTADHFWHGVTR